MSIVEQTRKTQRMFWKFATSEKPKQGQRKVEQKKQAIEDKRKEIGDKMKEISVVTVLMDYAISYGGATEEEKLALNESKRQYIKENSCHRLLGFSSDQLKNRQTKLKKELTKFENELTKLESELSSKSLAMIFMFLLMQT